MRRRMSLAAVAVAALGLPAVAGALDKDKAMYVGGTVTAGVPANTEGRLNVLLQDRLIFTGDKGGLIEIPYAGVSELEYGQKASRRLKTAILVSPLALFHKKRQHFVTVFYKQPDGQDQAVVLELGKDLVRTALTSIEARTGKRVTYQDDEARTHRAQ